jgi:uroporphyrinogen-III synthase
MGLEGKRIVIAGSRKTDEMSTLIEKQGGIPSVRSLQGTVFLADKQVEPELLTLVQEGTDMMIFTTGVGTETLLELAEKLGKREEFLQVIRQSDVASRGYKTFAALKKLEIKPMAKDEDGTTDGLIRALASYDFVGKRVVVQLHGETAPRLTQFLEDQGATVQHLLPYQHIAPEKDAVETLCKELTNDEVDAVCFTTAIQVRALFDHARDNGYIDNVTKAFEENVLAVAVGKVTAEALKDEKIERYIAPEIERMGAMIIELSRYYTKN